MDGSVCLAVQQNNIIILNIFYNLSYCTTIYNSKLNNHLAKIHLKLFFVSYNTIPEHVETLSPPPFFIISSLEKLIIFINIFTTLTFLSLPLTSDSCRIVIFISTFFGSIPVRRFDRIPPFNLHGSVFFFNRGQLDQTSFPFVISGRLQPALNSLNAFPLHSLQRQRLRAGVMVIYDFSTFPTHTYQSSVHSHRRTSLIFVYTSDCHCVI